MRWCVSGQSVGWALMLKRYRTLGAMLALGEFSASDLATLSGVRTSTVYTILRRESDLVEQLPAVPTGRRGGQPHRWRLRTEARERLQNQLCELEELGAGPWFGRQHTDDDTLPGGMTAAEDVLLRQLPAAAAAEEQEQLVRLAQAQLEAAVATVPSARRTSVPFTFHKRVIELLLELEKLESTADPGEDHGAREEVQEVIINLQLTASQTGDRRLVGAVENRLGHITSRRLDLHYPTERTGNSRTRHNLPIEPNRFVGRKRELGELTTLLGKVRILTLYGPGGIGKTRLALNLAAEIASEFPDGVWLADITDAADPEPVARQVAAAMGVKEEPGRAVADTLTDALRSRHLVVILDSCDGFVTESAELVEQLIAACPRLRIIATSRKPLEVVGEHPWRVPPLTLPDVRYRWSDVDLPQSEAMRLFTERAAEVLPGFILAEDNADNIARLCRELDGIPLAIEVTAPLVRALDVEQIAGRLSTSFNNPSARGGTSTSEKQALRNAVDWAYGLLTSAEQVLLRRLSVFVGWNLEMAEQVCADDNIPASLIAGLLAALVEKSLVTLDQEMTGDARYRLLDTIRDFARERLQAVGEQVAVGARHRDYLLRRVEAIVSAEFRRGDPPWWERVAIYQQSGAQRENYATALQFSLRLHHASEGLRFCSALRGSWVVRGDTAEGAAWFDRFLALDVQVASDIRATALARRAELAFEQQDYQTAVRCAEEGLELWRTSPEPRLAGALRVLALVSLRTADLKSALKRAEQAIQAARAVREDWEEGLALSVRAAVLSRQGRLTEGKRAYEAALEVLLDNNGWGIAHTLFGLGELARAQQDYGTASRQFSDALALYRDIDAKPEILRCLAGLGWVALEDGNLELASSRFGESMRLSVASGQRLAIARGLEAFAVLANENNQPERATILAGAALELRRVVGHLPSLRAKARIDTLLDVARDGIGSGTVNALLEKGRAMTYWEAANLAMRSNNEPIEANDSGAPHPVDILAEDDSPGLTPREYQVASLIGRGLSTRAVAAELLISPASASRSVAQILAKLGLRSQSEIAEWVALRSDSIGG
jgi:predicted ATPase/DNA-binding CsgD family transcriptional regulator